MQQPVAPSHARAVLVVPGPGLSLDAARRGAAGAGLDVVVADTLAADTLPGDVVGGLIAPGVEGFASDAVAAAVAAARMRILAVYPDDLREAGIDPRSSALARVGARIIYGRGPETTGWAMRHLRAWASNPPLTISYGDHPDQLADLWTPPHRPGPWPVVVLVHGGFWRHA